jgi:hypothetical protein
MKKIERMFEKEHYTPAELEIFRTRREICSRLNPGIVYRMSDKGLTIIEMR